MAAWAIRWQELARSSAVVIGHQDQGADTKVWSSCVMAAHNTALVLVAICVQVANAWVPPAVGRIGALAARPNLSAAGRSAGSAPLKMGLEIANDGEDEDAEEGINWMPPLTMTADVEKEDGAQVGFSLEREAADPLCRSRSTLRRRCSPCSPSAPWCTCRTPNIFLASSSPGKGAGLL